MRSFDELYEIARLHKGDAIESMLPVAKTPSQLMSTKDDRYLSSMCLRVFRAGLKHEMVDAKWPAFENAFNQFDPYHCAMMSDDEIDSHMKNASIIRHWGKICAVRANGQFVLEQSKVSNGFGRYLAEWPEDDIVGLWFDLKKQGHHMGGMSGPAFLRMVSRDTFLMTNDVVAALIREGVVSKSPTAKRDLYIVQNAFEQWRSESGRNFCEISRILSYTAI